MITDSTWETIIEAIRTHRRFIIVSHTSPDGDALGSEIGLAGHLLALGKQARIINSDGLPDNYRFLDSGELVEQYDIAAHQPAIAAAEVIFVLDASGGWQRVGPIGDALSEAEATSICIDHHPDSADFVDIAAIDTDAAATAELIYTLIRKMDGMLTPMMAQALYTAIITDTGSFRFPKTSPFTHHIAAALLEAGADPLYIYRQIFQQDSANQVRLRGHVSAAIQTEADGQLAYYSVDRDLLEQYGVSRWALEGFSGLAQGIGSVRVSIFFIENEDNEVKISLRSDGSVAINQIAVAYGGGGHPSAAGATVEGTLETVIPDVVSKVKALLLSEARSSES